MIPRQHRKSKECIRGDGVDLLTVSLVGCPQYHQQAQTRFPLRGDPPRSWGAASL